MKVLLTGASGYIGSVVAEKLVAASHQVVGLARSSHTATLLRERGLESRPGDLLVPDGLAATASGDNAPSDRSVWQWVLPFSHSPSRVNGFTTIDPPLPSNR
jgi:nucleoside-diphosphate-sugar epimerase